MWRRYKLHVQRSSWIYVIQSGRPICLPLPKYGESTGNVFWNQKIFRKQPSCLWCTLCGKLLCGEWSEAQSCCSTVTRWQSTQWYWYLLKILLSDATLSLRCLVIQSTTTLMLCICLWENWRYMWGNTITALSPHWQNDSFLVMIKPSDRNLRLNR